MRGILSSFFFQLRKLKLERINDFIKVLEGENGKVRIQTCDTSLCHSADHCFLSIKRPSLSIQSVLTYS